MSADKVMRKWHFVLVGSAFVVVLVYMYPHVSTYYTLSNEHKYKQPQTDTSHVKTVAQENRKTYTKQQTLGCWDVDANQPKRGKQIASSKDMSVEFCVKACNVSLYASLRNGTHCICSNTIPSIDRSYRCERHCATDGNECGGENAVTVYPAQTRFTGRRIKVAIIARARTGSTFLGNIFNHHPDVAYFFEPFHVYPTVPPNYKYFETTSLDMREKKQSSFTANGMKHLLNCEISKMPEFIVTNVNGVNMNKMTGLKGFWDCYKRIKAKFDKIARSSPFGNFSKLIAVKHCEDIAEYECGLKEAVVFKTIRMSAEAAHSLWFQDNDVKSILLLRDPRAVWNSRLHLQQLPIGSRQSALKTLAQGTCTTFLRDLREIRLLEKRYPNNFKIVYYEDLATNTTREMENIFNFTNLDFYPSVREFILSLSTGDKSDKKPFDTFRTDSAAVPFQWMKQLKTSDVKIIDDACAAFYKESRYKPAADTKTS